MPLDYVTGYAVLQTARSLGIMKTWNTIIVKKAKN